MIFPELAFQKSMSVENAIHEYLEGLEGRPWKVWHQVTLGPIWNAKDDVGRADVFALKCTWSPIVSRIYEVKISKTDLQADLRTGKWLKYLPHCSEFYFAIHEDLKDKVGKSDIPSPAGLIYIGNGVGKPKIRTLKTADFRKWKPRPHQLLALLMTQDTIQKKQGSLL